VLRSWKNNRAAILEKLISAEIRMGCLLWNRIKQVEIRHQSTSSRAKQAILTLGVTLIALFTLFPYIVVGTTVDDHHVPEPSMSASREHQHHRRIREVNKEGTIIQKSSSHVPKQTVQRHRRIRELEKVNDATTAKNGSSSLPITDPLVWNDCDEHTPIFIAGNENHEKDTQPKRHTDSKSTRNGTSEYNSSSIRNGTGATVYASSNSSSTTGEATLNVTKALLNIDTTSLPKDN
jgi:hypothetical protein